jgi:polar amino acid transport system substrate-binding protein
MLLAACGDDSKTTATTTAETTAAGTDTTVAAPAFTPIKAGTLTIVTSLPGPGFFDGSDTDVTKLNAGYEYDIAQALGAKLGLKVEIRNENFDAIVAGQAGNFDLALSQVTITADRAKVVDFTTPYFDSDQGIIAKAGTKVATLADAQGLLWGVQTGTTGADYVKGTVKPKKDPQVYQQLSDGFTALAAGQVDAFMMDTPIVLSEAAKSAGKLAVVGQFKTGEQYGGILPKGSANTAAINALLKGLKDDGSLSKFAAKDLGGDPTTVPVIAAS